MAQPNVLSQNEIDSVFVAHGAAHTSDLKVVPFDFGRMDRIPQEALRRIHVIHEGFGRNLGASLSAFLRRYVEATPISLDQFSYSEMVEFLTAPTCAASLAIHPHGGAAILEINQPLAFAAAEAMLGWGGQGVTPIEREFTQVEIRILEGMLRLIVQELDREWKTAANVTFELERVESDPSLLSGLSPREGVVAASFDMRIGTVSGMMNLAMPAITVKRLQRELTRDSMDKGLPSAHRSRVLRLLRKSRLTGEALLRGPKVSARELSVLRPGDLLAFDYAADRPIDLLINGVPKYRVELEAVDARKRARILEEVKPARTFSRSRARAAARS